MHYRAYLNRSAELIGEYDGSVPLPHYLKKHFAANKKSGARDRRNIAELCYAYFRLGHALKHLSVEERMLTAVFCCSHSANELLDHFKPEWKGLAGLSLTEKISVLPEPFAVADIFPWKNALSPGVDHEKLCTSLLVQPDLFVRIRPGRERAVRIKLSDHEIPYHLIGDSCLALPNSTKIDQVLNINEEVVVQDYSSQQTAKFFRRQTADPNPRNAWDCCAGSGGKSIMLFDTDRQINLTVSDIRESILVNLKKRFRQAGITRYRSFRADLSIPGPDPGSMDLIIADLPCSGSGTWSRNPEALFYFKDKQIGGFNQLQKKILARVIPSLKKEGRLVYITCSVFKAENDNIADHIQSAFNLKREAIEILRGYDQKADTMFAAAFTA